MKRKTNQQTLKAIMDFSKYGALAEIFVMQAVGKYAQACAAEQPEVFDSPLMNGAAWVGVAKEIAGKLNEFYGVKAAA